MSNKKRTVPGTFYLCSYGMRFFQISMETFRVLSNCQTLYTAEFEDTMARDIKNFFKHILPSLKFELGYFQAEGKWNPDIKKDLQQGKNVAFFTYGHPLFLNVQTSKLVQDFQKINIPCEVLHAVSSLDILLTKLDLNHLGPDGLYLANLRDYGETMEIKLNPKIPSLLFCVHPFGKQHIDKLMAWTLRLYPKNHRIELVHCSDSSNKNIPRRRFPLHRLKKEINKYCLSETLYIPAVKKKLPGNP